MNYGPTDIEGVIQSYADYLLVIDRPTFERFERARISERESAIAEAIVFRMLQTLGLRPELHERVGTGGADFLCGGPSPANQIIVEATSLDPEAVTKRSNLSNEPPEDIQGGPFGLVTRNVCNKAKDKDSQLAGYPMPRVLAIASSHEGIGALFNPGGAQYALVSEPHWYAGRDGEFTNLRDSVFIRPSDDKASIVSCRGNISAILLIGVYGDRSQVCGILHPDPTYPLNVGFFPKVPFIRLAKWPIVDGRISTEWVISDPDGYSLHHAKVRLPDLRDPK